MKKKSPKFDNKRFFIEKRLQNMLLRQNSLSLEKSKSLKGKKMHSKRKKDLSDLVCTQFEE